ncbi:MAG TPA: T9SS type A sorting domain-containing protein [Lentimicrobium sp.]|nr:T9SS type A sorting domain-containing protein [Lentimicrobium sp.]
MKRFLLFIIIVLCSAGLANAQRWADWYPDNGPYGGDVRAISVGTDNKVYAGTQGGGVFRSENGGQDWIQMNDGLTNTDVRAIVINNTGTLFAATMGGGVFKLEQGNTDWQPANVGLDYPWINTLIMNNNGDLYVGTYEGGGIYKSTNSGQSWVQVNNGLTTTYINALVTNSQGHIYAGGYMGIFLSTDNGANWVQKNSGISEPYVLSLAVNSEGTVFAGLDFNIGVYRSTDNAETWESISNGMGYPAGINALLLNNSDVLFAGTYGMGLFRTANNGDLWEAVNEGLGSQYIVSLAADNAGNLLAGSYLGGGIYFSANNGDTWSASYDGLAATTVKAFHHMYEDREGYILAATYGNGIFKKSMYSNDWIKITPDSIGRFFNDIFNNWWFATIYATADFVDGKGGLYKSTDLGETWQELLQGETEYDPRGVVANLSNDIFIATYGDGVLCSKDGGLTWERKNNGLDCPYLWCIAFDDYSNDLFVGSAGCGTGIYRSTDNGETWELINNGLLTTDIKSIRCYSSGFITAGTYPIFGEGGGVYKSYDNGDTWIESNEGLQNLYINDFEISLYGNIFTATAGGIYESYDYGDSWTLTSHGLSNLNIQALFSVFSDTYLYAGTAGSGSWRAFFPTDRKEYLFSDDLIVYPNPVINTLNFENHYQEGIAYFEVYNQNGELVKKGISPKGHNTIPVCYLKSGMYFIRVMNGNQLQKASFLKN